MKLFFCFFLLTLFYFLGGLPAPGQEIIVVESEKFAQEVVGYRRLQKTMEGQGERIKLRKEREQKYNEDLLEVAKIGVEEVKKFMEEHKKSKHFVEELDPEKTQNILIKADVPGSIEGLESAISEIPAENFDFKLNVISAAIGPLSEADVDAAKSSKAYLLSFNQKIPNNVLTYARDQCQAIAYHNIIYSVIDDLVEIIENRLPPTEKHVVKGRAIVLQTFVLSKNQKKKRKVIAGCSVDSGYVSKSSKFLARVFRDGEEIFVGPIESLFKHKDSVSEVKKGSECGIRIAEFDDYQEGDIIEAFETISTKTELKWKYTKNASEIILEKE